MIKTESEIERDFFHLIKGSALGAAVHGSVFRSEMRQPDAATEDIVVKFLSGTDAQIQTGLIILNIYVPDVPFGSNGRTVADKQRIEQLQSLLRDFIEDDADTEYELRANATPRTVEAEGPPQHIICARIDFRRISL